ncbi:MAG TPA: LysM peptidoglycan-binding domain-containing protein [Chloroflexota bacterium]|nr:LysM peptidoglycan-binding domain-containing protein [Chloroflexota bacterium]
MQLALVPPRVWGHAVVMVLCLAVAYAGRTSSFSHNFNSLSLGPTLFAPSAFAPGGNPAGDMLAPSLGINTCSVASACSPAPERLQIMHYQVQNGDTLADLANRFDISENTIVWANDLSSDGTLAPGQQLTILPVSGVLYTTRPGDTVATLATRFQSDAAAIGQFNQLKNTDQLTSGTQLVIPGGRLEDLPRPALASRSFVRPGPVDSTTSSNPAPQVASPAQISAARKPNFSDPIPKIPFSQRSVAPKPLTPMTYSVTAGDTLSSIAEHFGVSADSIAAASGIANSQDSLQINQKLTIPPVTGALHVVQSGDTLEGIAARYSVDPSTISRANGLQDPFTLQIGKTLVIPNGKLPDSTTTAPAATPAPAPTQSSYTVQEGDSISSIATSFGVDLRSIIDANGLTEPYLLQPGQQIVIPGASQPAPAATPAPATPTPAPAPPQQRKTYIVQAGDTLSNIAQAFGVDLSRIAGANSISDPSALQPGQHIVIPGVNDSTTASSQPVHAPAPAPAVAQVAAVSHAAVARVAVIAKPAPAPKPAPKPATSGGSGWNIVAAASKYLGVPYVWGGVSPSGFDCSGFVWYVYQRAGVPIPRDMWGQLQSGARVARNNLQPGDIVFFANTYEAGLSHDGIYIGGGRFINAVDYGIGVAVSNINDSYWSGHYAGATRPW